MNKGKIASVILLVIIIILGVFLWKSSQREETINQEVAPEISKDESTTSSNENKEELEELETAVKDLEKLLQSQKSDKDLDTENVGL